MEMENRRRELARRKRRRQRKLRRRLAGGAAVIVVGLAAFVCVWSRRGNADEKKIRPEVEAVIESVEVQKVVLPEKFDLRERKQLLTVPDQGIFSTCWAFAALKAVESSVPGTLELSADHMSLQNGFGVSQDEGGNHAVSSAYLLSWQGPVAEWEDPYGDGVTVEDAEPLYHVQEMQMLEERNFQAIKRAVYEHGGVQSALYVPEEVKKRESIFYNEKTSSYCYQGTEVPNHEVLIVGWDDTYAKENFLQEPERDGAFLCMNTWGEQFGDEGFFYISYEDSRIGEDCVVYTRIESAENYDRIYQTDLCGWTGQMGYGTSKAWFANVYKADSAIDLAAAGFYATEPDTKYKVYVAETPAIMELRVLAAEGTVENAGYYTIPLQESFEIDAGERFAVIVEIDSPNTEEPVAIEYRAGDKTAMVDIGDGEGYISFDGSVWNRTETEYQCNICLKVYANTVK